MNYEQQAADFLNECAAAIDVKYSRTGLYFNDDKEPRDIYNITISTPRGKMTFEFGNSVANMGGFTASGFYKSDNNQPSENAKYSRNGLFVFPTKADALDALKNGFRVTEVKRKEPTAYSVLACLTKYHPGTFEDFCSGYGYDTDSKKAEKTYYAVLKEYADLSTIFNHEQLEKMQEIS